MWPDASVRRALDACAAAVHAVTGGRRTVAENLHVTLAFLGVVDGDRLADLDALAKRVRVPPFELTIDRAGFFRRSGVAWAGVTTVPIGLTALAEALRARLSAAGLPFDPRPFVPHVTLARDARPAPLPGLAPVRWPVRDFVLVRSAGGRYTVLATYPLRPSV